MGERSRAVEAVVSTDRPNRRFPDARFWRDREVLLTGHTGFKGAWLTLLLSTLGARVTGLALPPEDGPSAYALLNVRCHLTGDRLVDVRNAIDVAAAISETRPSVVFHLAAQALVARGLEDPLATFEINVQGTWTVLAALRRYCPSTTAVIVTSDKVYRETDAGRRHVESDPLGGSDPYSASKAACEHVIAAYRAMPGLSAVATARAGNVIGGGDFAAGRLVPDMIRAEMDGLPVRLRQPRATRPFQHVLDVLVGYVLLAEDLAAGAELKAMNFGPDNGELSVAQLIALAEAARGYPFKKEMLAEPPFPEASRLALDSTLARERLGWRPALDTTAAVELTFEWYRAWREGQDTAALALAQIESVLR